jgi:hypothetical protein
MKTAQTITGFGGAFTGVLGITELIGSVKK